MSLRLAIAGAAALALGFAAPAHATFPGANGRIAFSSDRSGDYEIYTMNPDGSDLKRLTNVPGADGLSRWSPDGSKLVFTSGRDGNREIYMMNADGSAQTRLTTDPATDSFPSWSPDGTKIAFQSARKGVGASDIFVMNADGSEQTQITHAPPAVPGEDVAPPIGGDQPYWGPDGRIAFAGGDVGRLQVFIMNADGSGPTQVTNSSTEALTPAWSPDATRLLFATDRNNTADEIYVINADGTGETRLTSVQVNDSDTGPVFSPDGTKIVFTSFRDGQKQQLYLMDTDGSGQTHLLTTASNDIEPAWQSTPKLDPPKLGESANVSVVSGTVLVRARGAARFSLLAQARQIKVGSQLDTTRGVVRLVSAADKKGHTQSGNFGRGVFQVAQSKSAKGLTDLKLEGGKFGSCKGSGSKASASAKKKTIRSLFSKAKGKFRTKGRYSAATVRGTTWLVTDRCDGTLTSVKSGTVSVFDFKRHKTVKVKAGKSYLARASR